MAAVEPAQPEPRMMTLCAMQFLPSSREFAAGPNHYSSLPSRRHTSICHSDPERSRGGGISSCSKRDPSPAPPPPAGLPTEEHTTPLHPHPPPFPPPPPSPPPPPPFSPPPRGGGGGGGISSGKKRDPSPPRLPRAGF